MTSKMLLLLFILIPAALSSQILQKKILVIGIDGLRAGAAAMLPLPAFRRLESLGSFSYWAHVQREASAVSGPGWTSLMTGVEPGKHLVDGNGDLRDVSNLYPNFLKLVKDTFPNKTVAASVKWHPLIDDIIDYQDSTTLDGSHKASSDTDMAMNAEMWIRNDDYDLIFVDFDACDAAGHSSGFDGYADAYQQAVINTDSLVGKLLDAVESRSDDEEWLIILTSDHGGKGTSHGAFDDENRHVPLLVAGNSTRLQIGRSPSNDPGTHMDVLPTIMHFLQAPIPSYVDGQPFGFSDYVRTPPLDVSCLDSDPEWCGCKNVQQADYRGTISVTASGRVCQMWNVQSPQSHTRTPNNYPNSGLDENYCRNPDGEAGAWCYTTDPDKRWELCAVPVCGTCQSSHATCGCMDSLQSDYRGTISQTSSGKTCQRWDTQSPHGHDRTPEKYPDSGLEENYCRNPDGEPRAWCYTTDENKRWDFCDVPECVMG